MGTQRGRSKQGSQENTSVSWMGMCTLEDYTSEKFKKMVLTLDTNAQTSNT